MLKREDSQISTVDLEKTKPTARAPAPALGAIEEDDANKVLDPDAELPSEAEIMGVKRRIDFIVLPFVRGLVILRGHYD